MSRLEAGKKMRLLFICPGYGRISRGVEVFLHELVKRIDKDRFEITILCRTGAQADGVRSINVATLDRSKIEAYDGSTVFRMLRLLRLGSSTEIESFFYSLCATKHLSSHEYDLILPFGGYWTFLLAYVFKKSAKIVSVGHAGPVKSELRLSDAFVAITEFASCQAEEMTGLKKVVVIPNGVDVEKFHPGGARGDRAQTILCVAAFAIDKRHDLLFDAMMLMDRSVRLVCVGAGAIPASLSAHPVCKSHSVEFRCVSHEEMPDIYREADVFTLPSPEEAFGIVFLEAMATGLNVVAADAPRQRLVIGSPGFYCNVFDAAEYARSLREALTSPRRNSNIDRASQYGWDKVAREYQSFFASFG